MLLAFQVGLDALRSIIDDQEAPTHLAHLHLLVKVVRRFKTSNDWLKLNDSNGNSTDKDIQTHLCTMCDGGGGGVNSPPLPTPGRLALTKSYFPP